MTRRKLSSPLHNSKCKHTYDKREYSYEYNENSEYSPTERNKQYADQGYTGTRTDPYIVSNGKAQSAMHTCWTQKGRLFIYEPLKSDNIIPTMELLENNLSTLQKTS